MDVELGRQLAAGALEPSQAGVAPDCLPVARRRHRPADAGGEAARPQQPADLQPGDQRAAVRLEIHRQLAIIADLAQQLPQSRLGVGIDEALGRDPFLAARPAGAGLALGDVEHHRRRRLVSGPLVCGADCARAATAIAVATRQAERTSEMIPRCMDLRASPWRPSAGPCVAGSSPRGPAACNRKCKKSINGIPTTLCDPAHSRPVRAARRHPRSGRLPDAGGCIISLSGAYLRS